MKYLRYTTIHHDVREYFELTVCEYMVCDSIHQLSHGSPTHQANTKIAQHLGIDEGSVRNAKKKLIKMALLAEVDGGYTSTEKWNHFVTFRNNSEEIRNNSESLYIDKDNITSEQSSQKYEIVPDVEDKPKKFKSTEALQVFEVFKEVTGKSPLNWRTNKTQRTCAENLYKERGIEQIRKALEFHGETKDEPFCPAIHSPYDLDSKWTKLFEFKEKHYGD